MVFLWKYLIKPLGGIFGIYELLPAFLVGLLVIVVVSLLTKAPDESVCAEFDAARAEHTIFPKSSPPGTQRVPGGNVHKGAACKIGMGIQREILFKG